MCQVTVTLKNQKELSQEYEIPLHLVCGGFFNEDCYEESSDTRS